MKKTLAICFIILVALLASFHACATTYYFSSVAGNDSYTSVQAQNPATPWRSLVKLNSYFPSLLPGDFVLLKRGETFLGSITVGRSGTAVAPITISAYGSGNWPVVTGLVTISGWVSLGGGIYESAATPALLSSLNMVVIDGVQFGMGRWPNRTDTDGGFMKFESFTGLWNGTSSCTITDLQLTGTPNWVGATVVIKPQKWLLNTAIVTAHSGGTLTFLGDQPPRSAGFGYFIQNHPLTLTEFGEWYYNPSTKKIRMYFGAANPASYTIQATTIDSLLYSSAKSYIRVEDITFKGGNGSVVKIGGGTSFYIDSCHIQFAGIDGVDVTSNITSFRVTNSNVWDCNDDGIAAGVTSGAVLSGNSFRNCYMIPGMGGERDGHGWGARVSTGGTIEYNSFVNMGYIGAGFGGSNTTIQNNFFDSFCVVKDDAGAVYSGLTSGYVPLTNNRILNNIALNGRGNNDGTPSVEFSVHPYYLDDNLNGVLIEGNSAAYSRNTAVLLHNSRDVIVRNNTFYDNDLGAVNVLDDPAHLESQGLRFVSNIYATTDPTQSTAIFEDNLDGIGTYLSSDSNIYANLLSSNTSIINIRNNFGAYEYHDLPSWRIRYSEDINGSYSQKTIAPYRDLIVVGANKIPSPNNNSVFNACCGGWSGTAVYANSPGIMDGGYLQVTPSATAITDVAISVGTITAGTPYVVRFSVRGSSYSNQGSFGVRMQVAGTYYTPYQYYKILATRQEVEMLFVPQVTGAGGLRFGVSEGGTPFYLDNIYLYQATATVTNYQDSIRFEYNNTRVNKVVNLGSDSYKDVYGTTYSTSVTLAPFTSKVLIFLTGSTTPIVKINPIITWATPSAITYGTALSSTQLNATANVPGTFVYTPASGIILNAGTQTLSSEFIPTNETLYNRIVTTRSIVVNKATATLTLSGLAQTYDGSPKPINVTTNPAGLTIINITYDGAGAIPINAGSYLVSASLNNANYTATTVTGTLVIAKAAATLTLSNLNQTYNGSPKPITVITSPAGLTGVGITYNGSGTAPTNAGSYPIVASLTNTNYTATNAIGTLVIAKATPIVSWATPAAITYGTALSGSQLNATASVAGSFVYTPSSGSILNAGTQILSVNFTPTDAANYNSVNNTTVPLLINKAAATISLSNLTQVYDGTSQPITATTSPVGLGVVTITYDGSTTAPTNVGSYAVVASLSNSNYTATNATGTLTITKATATLTLSNLSYVYNGTQRSATVTTAPVGLSTVTITYDGSPTAPTNVGSYAVVASLSNVNYQATNETGTLVISKATPVIIWNNPGAITYGTALSGTQLNATSTVAGTFTYLPVSGTILNAGTQILSVDFTPTDAANYNSVTDVTRSITVNKATATITISNLAQEYDANPKPITVVTNPVGLGVITTTYNGSITAPTAVGSYSVISSLSNTNYTATNATGTLVISASVAAVTITNLSQTYDGSPKPVTVTVTGGWPYDVTYNGGATVPTNVASYTVIATINDGIHLGADTATLVINKANPVITWSTPSAITYGTALSGTQLNASSPTAGVFTYSPASGSVLNAGTQILSVSFVPTDAANYNTVPVTTVSLVVNKAVATITLSNLAHDYDGTIKTATATTSPVGLGVITITYNGSTSPQSAVGSYDVSATLNNSNYTATAATGTLVISASSAGISISNLLQTFDGTTQPVTVTTNPSGISYTVTYNASSTVPTNAGTYTVIATLTGGTFTGADTQTLVISKATPSLTWNSPAAITYGTALSSTQLNAIAGAAGSYAYLPASGAILNAGTQNLSVIFTPTDASNYNSVTQIVSITVNKATATLTLSNLSQTYDALPKPVLVTSSPAILDGISVTYNASATVPTNAGSYAIVVSLDNANYQATNATGTLVIAKANPMLAWAKPERIFTGTPLSSLQLNATSNIPGTFVYTPPAGTVLPIGTRQISATFTPTDSVNYSTGVVTTSMSVHGGTLKFFISNGQRIFINK